MASITPSSLFGTLNTGRQGLFANQAAIRVTGQNIANVNTRGYSRQRVIFDPSAFGNGVSIRTVQQIRDQFLDAQLTGEREALGLMTARQGLLAQMEMIFDETSGLGINTSLSEFFAALHDLAASPDGTAQRETVRTKAQALGSVFGSMRSRLERVREDADNQIAQVAGDINSLVHELAQLNDQINRQRTPSQEPLELLDQRQRVLSDLSELVDIEHFVDEHGQLVVFMAGGEPLVIGTEHSQLRTRIDPSNSGLSDVLLDRFDGQAIDLTGRISGGRLAGLLEVRDVEIEAQMDQLDRLAAQFATVFNLQHRVGTGLDGVSGRDFFDQVSVFSRAGAGSLGGVAQTGGAILDQSLLTFHDYEVRFTSATTYDIVDVTSGTTLSAGNTYVPGGAIAFDGLSITLDDVGGPPQAGDVIEINTYSGAAGSLDLDAAIAADLAAIGAGLSAEVGDNRNALDLAALESALLLNSGTTTFAGAYNAQVTSLGIASQQAERDWDSQQLVVQQIGGLIESVSGVSIDEESTNLIQFERAFQASSRVINVVDEMLQTIVSLV